MILDSPSAQRNKVPIWNALQTYVLPPLLKNTVVPRIDDDKGNGETTCPLLNVLEVAAGAGVHTEYFSQELFTHLTNNDYDYGRPEQLLFRWLPSDPDEESRNSILSRKQKMMAQKLSTENSSNDYDVSSCILSPTSLTLEEDGPIEGDQAFTNDFKNQNIFDLIICINMIHISPWTATLGLFNMSQTKLKPGGILYCYGPYKENGTAVESNLRFDRALMSQNPFWGIRNLEDVVKAAKERNLHLKKKIEMPANNLSLIFIKDDKSP